MSKTSGTKSYPAEFRAKAVKLVTERGFTIQQVAEHLGCSLESVRRWKEAAAKTLDPELAARIKLEESETKRLRKENAQLKMEVEILKKATASCCYNTARRRSYNSEVRLDQRTTPMLFHRHDV